MADEYYGLTGTAVTYNQEFDVPFHKYRAVEAFSQSSFSLMAPSNQPLHEMHQPVKAFPSSSSIKLQIITPNTETSQSPKCPEKPCFIPPNTSFPLSESNYEKVKESVERALSTLDDYDWSYFDNECMWKCKYFQGSNLRELHVYCYWDSRAENHILEVKRVRGDGISSSDFFSNLKSGVLNVKEEDCSHAKRGKLRGPLPLSMPSAAGLPLPKLGRSTTAGCSAFASLHVTAPMSQITEEQFLTGVKPIYSMSTDQFYEPRLEASKMLCDLATKEKKFLELRECHELCVKSLDALLLDDFEDVKQFAVMAFASFAELSVYHKSLLEVRGLESLVHLINNCPREMPAYQTAQMRRKAAIGLSLLATGGHGRELCEVLRGMGYETEGAWLDHCGTILDKKTREAAMTISKCYYA